MDSIIRKGAGILTTLFDLSQYETPATIEPFEFNEHQPPVQPIALNYLPTSTRSKAPNRKRRVR